MTYEENLERKNCPYRTDMGNCLSGGGFCLSVQTDKCRKHIEEALEKVAQLEKENKEMKRALNLFCSEFMCRECLFLDKENKQCTISKLFFDEKGQIK